MGERVRVALVCSECDARNYQTTKNKAKGEPIELKKYCPKCEKHTLHRESK